MCIAAHMQGLFVVEYTLIPLNISSLDISSKSIMDYDPTSLLFVSVMISSFLKVNLKHFFSLAIYKYSIFVQAKNVSCEFKFISLFF